jgi:hypothetical protein
MTSVSVPVPDGLFSTVRRTPDEVADEMRLVLALRSPSKRRDSTLYLNGISISM